MGSWQTQYGRSVDTLTMRGDGTFKQQYQDGYDQQYVYETPWSPWWLEPFADGRVRLHLQGARYYVDGIRIAELDGYELQADTLPRSFYDPFTQQHLEMVGELILNVRLDSTGELLLHHMTPGGDSGGGSR